MWVKQVLVRQFADIEREEWPRALLLSLFFFLVIATFWILKPLKRGVLINFFGEQPLQLFGMSFVGAESEQIAKVLNLVVVGLVMVLFTWLVRRMPRHYVVLAFSVLFGAAFVVFAAVIDEPNAAIVWSFFVLGDTFNSVFVALFWAFTNDVSGAGESKRTYGVIGLGGVLGGFLGATVVQSSVSDLGRAPLLLGCTAPLVLMVVIAFIVHRSSLRAGEEDDEPAAEGGRRSAALEGARLVFKSRYLIAIVLIIGSYELVSNVIDFQLAATVEREISGSLEKDAFFGRVGQIIGIVSILVQLFATSFVMRRFGLGTALSILPAAVFASSLGFLLFPTLVLAAAMSASDNALNYSINQSAKEALYVPTSDDVTYKAKAFIDMFVQRFAKVISVVLNLALVTAAAVGVRWLSLLSFAILGLWVAQVRVVGRRYEKKAEASGEDGPKAAPQ